MRISDWSSDVCSSDLRGETAQQGGALGQRRPAPFLLGAPSGGQPRVDGGTVVAVEARESFSRPRVGRGDHASASPTAAAKSAVPSGPPTSRVRPAGSARMGPRKSRVEGKGGAGR